MGKVKKIKCVSIRYTNPETDKGNLRRTKIHKRNKNYRGFLFLEGHQKVFVSLNGKQFEPIVILTTPPQSTDQFKIASDQGGVSGQA